MWGCVGVWGVCGWGGVCVFFLSVFCFSLNKQKTLLNIIIN